MNPPPSRKSRPRRARPQPKRKRADIWQAPRPLPAVEPIRVAPDPTVLIRSLGEPPLQRGVSAHYLSAVAARASAFAAALAASAGLLAESESDSESESESEGSEPLPSA